MENDIQSSVVSQQGMERAIIDELMGMERPGDTHALLEFLRDNVKAHFPPRFKAHFALTDPSLSIANLNKDDKTRILALRNLLVIFEMARRFWFEVEDDHDFYIQALQEEVSLLNQLSRGDGTMLYVIRSTFKEVGITQPSHEEKRGLWRSLLRR